MKLIQFLIINSKLCVIEIWSNKRRSFLTSFGIFLGITSLLVNISFIRGMDNGIKKDMEAIGGLNILTLKKKVPVNDQDTKNFSISSYLKISDAEFLIKRVKYARTILPSIRMPWGPVTANGKKTYAIIEAVGPDHQRVYNIHVDKGNNLSRDDHLQKKNVCIVGKRIVKRLFPSDNLPIGKQITMNKCTFTIIGIIQTDTDNERNARKILFPFSLYSQRFNGQSGKLDEIAIELWNSDHIENAINEMRKNIKELHRGNDDVEIQSNLSKISEMRNASKGITILLISIATISLLVGSISIMNIMFAAIGDRIREIGIRKALGANKTDIFLQFIIESVMLCLVGGIPGMFLGGLITLFPKDIFPFTPSLSSLDYLLAVSFTVLAGFLSGITPAIIAAKMQPVEALRH